MRMLSDNNIAVYPVDDRGIPNGDAWEGAVDILITQSAPTGSFSRIFENRLNGRFSDEQREQSHGKAFL